MVAAQEWHTIDAAATARRLSVNPSVGLGTADVSAKRREHGPNVLPAREKSGWPQLISNQFRDFMIVVLMLAAVVSGIVGDLKDAIAILVILCLNAVVGIVQEYRAERALEALGSLAVATAQVRRNGHCMTIPASELVPGDIVLLEAGSSVPADIRLLELQQLATDESALTGESEVVAKQVSPIADVGLPIGDRRNLVFCGTLIARGRGEGVVVATGADTELGRIASMLQSSPRLQTPLQRRLARFGKRLAIVVLAICTFIFTLGLLRGEPVVLMFMTAVSLAVAAIPEALPAVVTVSLALGARKMSRANALIRRLPAVETLGSVTYICADKTGTLTQNRMHVDFIEIDGARYDRIPDDAPGQYRWLGPALAVSNDVTVDARGKAHGAPTELALFEFAKSCGYQKPAVLAEFPRIREVPFHSEAKCMTTIHGRRDGAIAFLKGAPEAVIPRCTAGRDAETRAAEMAHDGYRVLAIAAKMLQSVDADTESDFALLGLAALSDPPREGVPEAVELCRRAGITPIMITGDHPGTALAIAGRIGISVDGDSPITGPELARLGSAELMERIDSTHVYARVDPAQKIDIVRALQARGEFVAMTGDGVNDAPALRCADIGVAMGKKGTDAARESADMVLLDDNFSTIVSAVREGRRIFDNILSFIRYALTCNTGEVVTLLMAPLFGLPIPLLPIHILWINLVTDGLPGLALTAEPSEEDAMRRPPRPADEKIFTRSMVERILWIGLLIGGLSITAQAWAFHGGSSNWQTVVFTVLTFTQLVNVLVIRSENQSAFSRGFYSNRPLLLTVALTFALQLVVIYAAPLQSIFNTAALTPVELAVCVALSMVVLLVSEIEKLIRRKTRIQMTGIKDK